MNKRKLRRTFDEVFKKRATSFFEKFAKVETEYELHRLPRKLDVLVIESDKPIGKHLDLMNYFKEFNIIEFKSENDRFGRSYIYKLLYYISALYLRKKKGITLSLISMYKPETFIKEFKFISVKKGLYKITIPNMIEMHLIIVSELEETAVKELDFLSIFMNRKNRKKIIRDVIKEGRNEDLKDIFLLYKEEIQSILEEMGTNMTAIEERVWELAEEFGIREKSIQEGREQERLLARKQIEKTQNLVSIREKRAEHKSKLRTAIKMKRAGFTLDFISEMTEIQEVYLKRFFKKNLQL